MSRSSTIPLARSSSLLLLACLLCMLSACGGSKSQHLEPAGAGLPAGNQQRTLPPIRLSEALAQVAALPAPKGVDAALWKTLQDALSKLLTQQAGKLAGQRFVSAAPTSPDSKVTDLAADGAAMTLSWSYRNIGDYNQDGQVLASDLSPIGIFFQKHNTDANWASADPADGNRDGLISVTDLTPIGLNFRKRLDAYIIQSTQTPADEGSWTQFASVPLNTALPAGASGYKSFSFDMSAAPTGSYRVVPADTSGAAPLLGIPSNAVQYSAFVANPLPGVWAGPGGGPQNTNYFDASGPIALGQPQYIPFGQTFASCFQGSDGNIYANESGDGVDSATLDGSPRWQVITGNKLGGYLLGQDDITYVSAVKGTLYAIDSNGGIIWQTELGTYLSSISQTPAGDLVGASGKHTLLCLSKENGSENWHFAPADPDEEVIGAGCSPSGNVYALTQKPTAAAESNSYYDNRLVTFNAAGVQQWEFPSAAGDFAPGGDCRGTVLVTPDNWAILNDADEIRGVSPDGQTTWYYTDDLTQTSVSIGPNGKIYFGSQIGVSDDVGVLNSDGTTLLRFASPGDVHSPPIAGSDGRIWWDDTFEGLKTINPDVADSYWNDPELGVHGYGFQEPSGDLIQPSGPLVRIKINTGIVWSLGNPVSLGWPPAFRADGRMYLTQNGLKLVNSDLSEVWSFPVDAAYTYFSAPTIRPDGSIVFWAGASGAYTLWAVDASGSELWHHDFLGGGYNVAVGSDGAVYYVYNDYTNSKHGLVKVAADGSGTQELDLGANSVPQVVLQRVSGGGDRIYIRGEEGSTYWVRCVDESLSNIYGPVNLPDGKQCAFLIALNDGSLVTGEYFLTYACLIKYKPNGDQDWSSSTWLPNGYPAAMPDGSLVLVGWKDLDAGSNRINRLLRLDASGNHVWDMPLKDHAFAYPTPLLDADGKVYLNIGGKLYCYDSDGNQLFVYDDLPGAGVIPGPDGHLYLKTTDNVIVL